SCRICIAATLETVVHGKGDGRPQQSLGIIYVETRATRPHGSQCRVECCRRPDSARLRSGCDAQASNMWAGKPGTSTFNARTHPAHGCCASSSAGRFSFAVVM